MGVGLVAIVVIVAAVAVYFMPEGEDTKEPMYCPYEIVEVKSYTDLSHQYSALVRFAEPLPDGAYTCAIYDGAVVSEYTTTHDGVTELRYWFNLPYTATTDMIRNGLTVEVFS